MNHLTTFTILALLAAPAAAAWGDYQDDSNTFSQYDFSDETGKPTGSARRSGSSVYFYNDIGAPVGRASSQGDRTYFYDKFGAPTGSVKGR